MSEVKKETQRTDEKHLVLKPHVCIFLKGSFVFEDLGIDTDFWTRLGDGLYGLFSQRFTQGNHVLVEVRPEPDLSRCPEVCLQGVLWTRKAGLAAERDISSYRLSPMRR